MVLQKILKSDHILSGRVLPNALFELRRNYQINSLALHLPNLPLGNLLVYRSQKEPQSLCAFRDDLAPSLSQCSFGRKNYRVLSILLVQANGWKDKVWITINRWLRLERILEPFKQFFKHYLKGAPSP